MRKLHKQQILEVIQSLHEIHGHCRDQLKEKNYQTVQNLLTDCQDAAIQIGELIEQLEEILIKAENEISRIKVRKEVAFLPYKASMWDSLESVYLAAKEDEDCDAYVVSVPYYDKLPDDSLGELHYEGNKYPPDIEITYYEDYNLEERHPDAIYIHNPYDRWNIVTCVPEQFFCSNLKQYTDCLVYIPHFILNEIEPDDQAAIGKMKHFCFLPGTIWADMDRAVVLSDAYYGDQSSVVQVYQETGKPVMIQNVEAL